MRKIMVFIVSVAMGILLASCSNTVFVSSEDIVREALEEEGEPIAYETELEHIYADDGVVATEKHLINVNGDIRIDTFIDDLPAQSYFYHGDDPDMDVKDFDTNTIVKRERDVANTLHLPKQDLGEMIDNYFTTHTMEVKDGETYLDREVYHLIFEPEEEEDVKYEAWVDKETFLILRDVSHLEDGTWEMRVTSLRLDIELTDADFELGDTEGFEYLESKQDILMLEEIPDLLEQPGRIPEQAVNEWEGVTAFVKKRGYGAEDTIVIQYIDQDERKIIFEVDKNSHWEYEYFSEETVRGLSVKFRWEPSMHRVDWVEDGLRYQLFTEQDWSREEAIKVIESMQMLESETD